MIQTKRRMKLTKTSERSIAATLLRQSENVLGIAQAVRSRSNRALGFVNQHRVHFGHQGSLSCRQLVQTWFHRWCLTCRMKWFVHGCQAPHCRKNRACVLGCLEGLDCLRHCDLCRTLFDHSRSLWPGNGECISPTTIFNDLFFKVAVRK